LDFQVGFDRARIEHAVRRTDAAFAVLDARLADGRAFLSGDTFSLSDIAWMPNVHRFALMGWPFENTPFLSAWFDQVKSRPSYDTALMSWQPDAIQIAFAVYSARRTEEGTDVRAFLGGYA
jgi:glutathione S-transferase